MRLIIPIAACAVLMLAGEAEAAGRWRAARQNRAAASGAYARAVYPKYYGGFHSRQLQNIGVPTGDIGLRGNGITATPW